MVSFNRPLSALALTLAGIVAANTVHADAALAASRNCFACHTVDRKVVGPPYRDVARKYAGQPAAVEKLAAKIRQGGAGVWGVVPMPANPQVSEAESRKLAAWVLSLGG